MQDIYLDKIVDITDPYCQFLKEFDEEIYKYGAIVYNSEVNSYQFIRHFNDIDYKKELLPDFIKVENSDKLLNGLSITIHYEFDPEVEEDQDNLDIWNYELSQMLIPYYDYDNDEGEVYQKEEIPFTTKPTKHIVWFLDERSHDYISSLDLLIYTPIIKQMSIISNLIRNYCVHPFEFVYQKDDSFVLPELEGVYQGNEDTNQ
ncbi:MAG: hypothetical protein ACI4WG_04035 [Erysipelotrichaceae bacterium]